MAMAWSRCSSNSATSDIKKKRERSLRHPCYRAHTLSQSPIRDSKGTFNTSSKFWAGPPAVP
eukprot:7183799-Ditylum_brightwellii.AAC.1